MKISDIIELELNNDVILLHREGIFWRAYELSAYLFVEYIKQYDIKIRYYKKIKQDVVYIGFPDSVMDSIMEICTSNKYKIQKETEKEIRIDGSFETEEYTVWKALNVQHSRQELSTSLALKSKVSLLQEIADYPLALKTPMEAQQFLYEIQMRINGII